MERYFRNGSMRVTQPPYPTNCFHPSIHILYPHPQRPPALLGIAALEEGADGSGLRYGDGVYAGLLFITRTVNCPVACTVRTYMYLYDQSSFAPLVGANAHRIVVGAAKSQIGWLGSEPRVPL